MTIGDLKFIEELNHKDFDWCSLRFVGEDKMYYILDVGVYAVKDVKSGKTEVRGLSEDEKSVILGFHEEIFEEIRKYAAENGYGDIEDNFEIVGDIDKNSELFYICCFDESNNVAKEEFVSVELTYPIVVKKASDEEMDSYLEYLDICENEVNKAAKEDGAEERLVIGQISPLKFKPVKDMYQTTADGRSFKVCYMVVHDDILTVGGLDVEDMEDSLKDRYSKAVIAAVERELKKFWER